MRALLDRAFEKRLKSLSSDAVNAYRLFHGPGEGDGAFRSIAIDRFGDYAWCTFWQKGAQSSLGADVLADVESTLQAIGIKGAVWLNRPEKGTPQPPTLAFGTVPEGRFEVFEGRARFWVQLLESLHPGLFLDHADLRKRLVSISQGLSVLNLFSYTGSLSVAAAIGGATSVKSVDLSRPFSAWARENWLLNGLSKEVGDFIVGDSFEWLKRFAKRGERFDMLILDPPSFSRGPSGAFSTQKDLKRLHLEALRCLSDQGGWLVTSINSAGIPRSEFEAQISAAVRESGRTMRVVHSISQPSTFPARAGDSSTAYLKGLIAEISGI